MRQMPLRTWVLANIRGTRPYLTPDQIRRDLDVTDNHGGLIALNEMWRNTALLRGRYPADRWHVVAKAGCSTALVLDKRLVKVHSSGFWHGHGPVTGPEERPVVSDERPIAWAIYSPVEDPGLRILDMCIHATPSAWSNALPAEYRDRARKAWYELRDNVQARAAWAIRQGMAVVCRGDWNYKPDPFARRLIEGQRAGRATSTNLIDKILFWNSPVAVWQPTAQRVMFPLISDHDGMAYTMRAVRKAAPTPAPTPPKEQQPVSNYPRAYLVDHPPARRQFRDRQAKPTGCMVIHTAESAPDEVGPDTGAENVARFIRDRSTPGSYHDLADSDSDLHLVPYAKAAYGDGTGSNEWAIHISAATQAHRWPTLPQTWRESTVRRMAACAARANAWLIANGHPACPPVRITRAQSEAGQPGFISHGDRDPGRRTDPGRDFPWPLFLDTYASLTAPQEDDMPITDDDAMKIAKAVLRRAPVDDPDLEPDRSVGGTLTHIQQELLVVKRGQAALATALGEIKTALARLEQKENPS